MPHSAVSSVGFLSGKPPRPALVGFCGAAQRAHSGLRAGQACGTPAGPVRTQKFPICVAANQAQAQAQRDDPPVEVPATRLTVEIRVLLQGCQGRRGEAPPRPAPVQRQDLESVADHARDPGDRQLAVELTGRPGVLEYGRLHGPDRRLPEGHDVSMNSLGEVPVGGSGAEAATAACARRRAQGRPAG